MESELTSAEKLPYVEARREAARREASSKAAEHTRDAARSRLSIMEKLAFGVASVLSAVVLVICLMLTVVGFIFSPIAVTLLFGLLTAATGITSYVIWRGGQCRRANS